MEKIKIFQYKSEKPRLSVLAFALLHQYENPFGLSPCRSKETIFFEIRFSVFDVRCLMSEKRTSTNENRYSIWFYGNPLVCFFIIV